MVLLTLTAVRVREHHTPASLDWGALHGRAADYVVVDNDSSYVAVGEGFAC